MTTNTIEIIRYAVEIAVLAITYYYIFRVLRGTRGMTILVTMIVFLALVTFCANVFKLQILQWILYKVFTYLPFFLIVVFQTEIRRLLTVMQATLGRTRLKTGEEDNEQTVLLVPALERMSNDREGALIAIEQKVGLEAWIVSGKTLNAPLRNNRLIEAIFREGGPLHDGGMVIRNFEIVAASCTFPLLEREDDEETVNGMRHQAAVGLSEQCDAVIIVVSEETGRISIAHDGKLKRMETHEMLCNTLNSLLLPVKTAQDDSLLSIICHGWKQLAGFKRIFMGKISLGKASRKGGQL